MTSGKAAAFGVLLLSCLHGVSFAAESRWTHGTTKISVDKTAGNMNLRQEPGSSQEKMQDMILQYGDSDTGEPATLYLYRSTFPNPALWFERTVAAMHYMLPSLGDELTPQPFTLGGGLTPNGLRMIASLPPGSPYTATGVAMAQVGEWILKFRVTSASLDAAGVAKRLDDLIGAVHLPSAVRTPHPLMVPARCENEAFESGEVVTDRAEEDLAAAGVGSFVAYAAARGTSGLAAAPDEWCRGTSNLPPELASLYRRKTGRPEWVVLFGDSGRSMMSQPLEPVSRGKTPKAQAALYANRLDATHVVALYDGVPSADMAAPLGLPVMMGKADGLVSVSFAADGKAQRRKK